MSCGSGKSVSIDPQLDITLPKIIQSGGGNRKDIVYSLKNNKYLYVIQRGGSGYIGSILDLENFTIRQQYNIERNLEADLNNPIEIKSAYRYSKIPGRLPVMRGGSIEPFREILETLSHVYAPLPAIINTARRKLMK